jgi:L-asparagine transporter-like permease
LLTTDLVISAATNSKNDLKTANEPKYIALNGRVNPKEKKNGKAEIQNIPIEKLIIITINLYFTLLLILINSKKFFTHSCNCKTILFYFLFSLLLVTILLYQYQKMQ